MKDNCGVEDETVFKLYFIVPKTIFIPFVHGIAYEFK